MGNQKKAVCTIGIAAVNVIVFYFFLSEGEQKMGCICWNMEQCMSRM